MPPSVLSKWASLSLHISVWPVQARRDSFVNFFLITIIIRVCCSSALVVAKVFLTVVVMAKSKATSKIRTKFDRLITCDNGSVVKYQVNSAYSNIAKCVKLCSDPGPC